VKHTERRTNRGQTHGRTQEMFQRGKSILGGKFWNWWNGD